MVFKRILTVVGVVAVILALAHLIASGLYSRPRDFSHTIEIDRPDCRVGVQDGTDCENIARAEFPTAQVCVFGETEDTYAALLAGRLEAVVGCEHELNMAIRTYPRRFKLLDDVLDRSESVVVISPALTNLPIRINKFIANYRRLGFYDDAYCRWCQSDAFVDMPKIPQAGPDAAQLRIGTSGTDEPISFFTDGGDLVGYDIEFGMRLAQYLRMRPAFTCAPRSELAGMLAKGQLDIVIDRVAPRDVPPDTLKSDSYFDADTRAMVRSDDDDESNLLGSARIGYSSRVIRDPRLALFVTGFLTTLALTVLSAAVGFLIAFLVRSLDRRLPIRGQVVVSVVLEVFRLLPPPIVILLFGCAGRDAISSWFAAIASLACWFAADVEPMCGLGAKSLLSATRTRMVGLMQWTSVVGCLNICDLAMAADIVCGRSMHAVVPLMSVAAAYCLMNWLVKVGVDILEEKLS